MTQTTSYNRRKGTRSGKGFPHLMGWLLRIGLAVLLGLVVFIIVRKVQDSSFLEIWDVAVAGNQRLKAEQVIQAADLMGKNMLTVDRSKAKQSVESLPLVKKASITLQPPHQVTVTIEERQPWALWQVGASKYIIDDEGVIIGNASTEKDLITIVDIGSKGLKLGSRVDPKSVQLAQKLAEVLPQEMGTKAMRFEYGSLQYGNTGGLVVVTDKGWRARFGDMEDFDFKLAVWKAILAKAAQGKQKVNHVDLRFGYRPFFR